MRAFVVRKQAHQLAVVALLTGGIALETGFEPENQTALALGDAAGERRRMRDGVDELFRGAGRGRQPQIAEREVLVLRHRLLEQPPPVGGSQLLEQIAPLQIERPGLGATSS